MKHSMPAGPKGVPTTPPPSQAAPNPWYNDLTRPRLLQLDAGANGGGVRVPSPAVGARCWKSSETTGAASSSMGKAITQNQELGVHDGVGSLSNNRTSRMPLPWQGPIKLPDSDEEIMNAAQTWILQILHESSEDLKHDVGLTTSESLIDGRILCRVVNEIASGSVKVISDVDTHESQVNNIGSFLEACRKFGVPEGALFRASDRDPKRVALCLYILSRVIQDTVPSFSGPFVAQPISTSSSRCGDSPSSSDDTSRNEHHSHHRSARKVHHLPLPPYLPPSPDQRTSAMESWREESHSQQRPLSLPSRFSHACGGGVEERDGAWVFSSTAARGMAQGDEVHHRDAQLADSSAASTPGRTRLSPRPSDRNLGSLVQQQPEEEVAATSSFTRNKANSLSPWLSGLNLGNFELALVAIGVETTGDLRYVEGQDLATIGMHGPQIRKFLQNRP